MKIGRKRYLAVLVGLPLLLLFSPQDVHADSFTFDTSSLVGSSSGPFEIFVVLEDSSMAASMTNTATLTGFNFGGGSAGPMIQGGGASGSLTSGINLLETQANGINYLLQAFTPGNTLSFNFSMTTNANGGLNPQSGLSGDEFLFFILGNGGSSFVQTTDTVTPDALLTATVCPSCSNGLSIQQFSIPSRPPSVPEPATVLLLASGVVAIGLRRRGSCG